MKSARSRGQPVPQPQPTAQAQGSPVLIDPQQKTVVSSLGWVDGGAFWILDVGTGRSRSAQISDARYLSLHAGREGHFAATHHYEAGHLAITAHSFSAPDEIVGRCIVSQDRREFEGPTAVWDHLPKHYVAYLVQPAWSQSALVSLWSDERVQLQIFDWYDGSYDPMYQGIVGVTEIPGSELVLVSVQRSSTAIIHDPVERCKVGELVLSGGTGNPRLYFRRTCSELWADDYDTLVTVDPSNWGVVRRRKLQGAAAGTAQFIGQFAFNPDESICAVARPFSGDVVGLDPQTLRTRYRARLGAQPLKVALLSDRRVFARDWKSGDLLSGTLRRTWTG
jgi:hypothetical protein